MIDEATLSANLLNFARKTYAFDHLARVGEAEYALFSRTETESESKFRPKLVHLYVAVPREWLAVEGEEEGLAIRPPGEAAARGSVEAAVDVAHEAPEFDEQGARWKRGELSEGRRLYVPLDRARRLLTPSSEGALGL